MKRKKKYKLARVIENKIVIRRSEYIYIIYTLLFTLFIRLYTINDKILKNYYDVHCNINILVM